MITYKFFRDKFFVLSDKPLIKPFGKKPLDKQIDIKPVGMWFSRGLQWFNLVLNSHHNLYNVDNASSGWANKKLYLHQIDLNWEHILQINNDDEAVKFSAELFLKSEGTPLVWKEYIKQNPNVHGIYCRLDTYYNVDKRGRRGESYRLNTNVYEERNMNRMEEKYTSYLLNTQPKLYKSKRVGNHSKFYSWYPTLSISSGCIWNGKAVNFDKCKLIMELTPELLLQFKASENSVRALLDYINENNIIPASAVDNSQNNNKLVGANSPYGYSRLFNDDFSIAEVSNINNGASLAVENNTTKKKLSATPPENNVFRVPDLMREMQQMKSRAAGISTNSIRSNKSKKLIRVSTGPKNTQLPATDTNSKPKSKPLFIFPSNPASISKPPPPLFTGFKL
jgi:hypothetical protein